MKLGALLQRSAAAQAKRFKRSPKKAASRGTKTRLRLGYTQKPEIQQSSAPVPVSVPITPKPQSPLSTSGLWVTDLIRPNTRITEALEGFLLDQRSEHTRRAYGKDLKRFVKFLHARNLDRPGEQLSRSVIIGYREYLLAEKLSHPTIDRHLATLRAFFQWLCHEEIIEKNPAENVRFLGAKRLSSTQGLSDEEVKRILALPNLHTRTGSLHYAVLCVLFYCGLRRSELCAIRLSQIQQERGHTIIRLQGKGNQERIVVLVPRVWNSILHYFRITKRSLNLATKQLEDPLFSPIKMNRSGTVDKPLDPSMIFYIVRKYANLAGIERKISPHSCRATAISHARDRNVPDRAIQEFAGWSTTSMITRYDKRKSAIENSASHSIDYGDRDRSKPG